MTELASTLERWQAFYATIGTSAATLTGLLFVAVSLERGRATKAAMRHARGALADFLYVLMLALVFLVPDQTPVGLAVALVVLSLARAIALARSVLRPTRGTHDTREDRVREIALPAIAVVGLLLVAVAMLTGSLIALFWLVGVLAALLVRATWTSWLFLVGEAA